jgi:hypothetical protein
MLGHGSKLQGSSMLHREREHMRAPFSLLSQGIGWKCEQTSLTVLKDNVTRLGATRGLKVQDSSFASVRFSS